MALKEEEAVMETTTVHSFALSDDEREVVREVLESEDVRMAVEIRHTDKRAFREELKRRQHLVEEVLARLSESSGGREIA